MGEAKTAQLKAALEMGRRLSALTPGGRSQITSPTDVANLMMLEMGYLAQEQLQVLCLDAEIYVAAQQVVYQGTVNSSVVRVAEVFQPRISRTCPAIVVIHIIRPATRRPYRRVRTTEQLRKAGELLDIELLTTLWSATTASSA